MGVGSLDDLDHPRGGFGRSADQLRPLIAGVGENALDEGEEAARAVIEDEPCSVAILHISGVDATFSRRPSVSTRIWRLRPVIFLPASKPCRSSVEPPFEPPWRSGCR
jgi:hypothetical protein